MIDLTDPNDRVMIGIVMLISNAFNFIIGFMCCKCKIFYRVVKEERHYRSDDNE